MRNLMTALLAALAMGVIGMAFCTAPQLPLFDKRVIGERCADGAERC